MGPKEISGFEGDTLSLQCTYGEELRKHKKYWCREGGLLISRCSGTIYAEEDGQERTAGRVSVWDSPKELTLTVTLRNLTLQDAGKYWCGVSRLGFDWSFLVSLRVLPGNTCLSFLGWGTGDADGRRECGWVITAGLGFPVARGRNARANLIRGLEDSVRWQRSSAQQHRGHRQCHPSLGCSVTPAAQGHSR